MKILTASFPSTCPICLGRIEEGDDIAIDDEYVSEWCHVECLTEEIGDPDD